MNQNLSSIVDPDLATAGSRRIDWAKMFMPALAAATADIGDGLAGHHVGVMLTLEPKTANLALAFQSAGADVSVFCGGTHTSDDVAAGLAARGVAVHARSDADPDVDRMLLHRFLDDPVDLLVDDGASIIRMVHTERRDALKRLKGAAEETTSGVRPLRVMAAEGVLEVPCLAVNDALTKTLFDNVYGTGQSVVMTLLDLTNIQLQGKSVVVVGYGYVGQGIAAACRALGARVTVTEVDAVRALQAVHNGYRVTSLEEMAPRGEIFITATGIGYSLVADHMRRMRDGAIVSVGGAGPPEVSLEGAEPLMRGDLARAGVRSIPVRDGQTVFLIADGECSNVSAGEGNPIEIMDLSLAVQIRSVHYLATHHAELEPGVHEVPAEVDRLVAISALRAAGATLDTPSERQIDFANSWRNTRHQTSKGETL